MAHVVCWKNFERGRELERGKENQRTGKRERDREERGRVNK